MGPRNWFYNEDVNPSSFPRTIPFIGTPGERGQTRNFAPRFGLAWNVRGTTKDVIRAGFGMYYNNIQTLLKFPGVPEHLAVQRADRQPLLSQPLR